MAKPPVTRRPASGPTRLLDVANAAGVSLRTASRVLNDDPRVAPVTRQRVREAILDLRFEPDAMARSLRAGTDTAVGFVVESISDPFFAEVIDAVELEMSRHGRSVLVTSTRRDPGWERDVIGRMMQRRVAGLLLGPTGDDHAWLDPHVPVVLVDRPAPGLSADLVEIDDHRAAFDAVAHLIAHGHRRIAYIGDTPAIPTSAARLRGYRDALARYQIEADEHLVNCACPDSADAAHPDRSPGGFGRPDGAPDQVHGHVDQAVRVDLCLAAAAGLPRSRLLGIQAVAPRRRPGYGLGRGGADVEADDDAGGHGRCSPEPRSMILAGT
ncbi:MAG TPA: LacI family DNA-binding transcriptional regulator [Nakamurella sp.]